MSIDEASINKVYNILNVVMQEVGYRRGNQVKYHCPFCHHHKQKLEININQKSHVYHCWVCNAKGTIPGLLRKINASRKYVNEVLCIYRHSNGYNNKTNSTIDTQVKLPNEYVPLYVEQSDLYYKHAIYFCKKRGLTASDIAKYKIGYAFDNKFSNRIILPSFDCDGNLNFFTARSFLNDSKLKYLNPACDRNIIGYDLYVNWKLGYINLCEGCLDAIAIKDNAIPLFGKTMSVKLMNKILNTNIKHVNILLDSDAIKSTLQIAEQLLKEGITIGVLDLDKKDPSEIGYMNMHQKLKNIKILEWSELMKRKIYIG